MAKPPLTVLIADDEPKIRRMLEQILLAQGCVIRVACDGFDALAQFQQQPADVVITDIKMPRVNGLELVEELKRLDPLVNVVVITAYPSVEGAVQAMKIGACDFLTKPFELAHVQTILYRCRQRLQLSQQLRSAGEGLMKLEELNRRLTEAGELKNQFLAAISHEIHTPLCVISEWLNMLSEGSLGEIPTSQREAVAELTAAYERLRRLLEQLIDLTHGPNIILRPQHVLVQELVREAAAMVTSKASSRGITISSRLPQEPLRLSVDRSRCLTALQHLLENAVKFNRDGGSVEIEVTDEAETVHVRIQDTGIGIPSDEQEKVFAPFYQVDRRIDRAYPGAGVGLTLAKRYIELHHGSITLSSRVDVGTTVTLALPHSAAAGAPLSQTTSAA